MMNCPPTVNVPEMNVTPFSADCLQSEGVAVRSGQVYRRLPALVLRGDVRFVAHQRLAGVCMCQRCGTSAPGGGLHVLTLWHISAWRGFARVNVVAHQRLAGVCMC
jgi:hypothetical protein